MTWMFWIGISVLAITVPAAVLCRLARAKRIALGKLTRLRLESLQFAVQAWQGSGYDLVTYDSDQHRDRFHHWRTIEIRPNAATCWIFSIDLQKRYRVSVRLKDEETWYPPRNAWSEEPWLKAQVDVLLMRIGQLPPPHTLEEHLRKQQAEHLMRMAGYDREHAEHLRWMEELATEGNFPSLDDPCDDLD